MFLVSKQNQTETNFVLGCAYVDGKVDVAMGQNPVPPVNIPIHTKIDGWCTYPKMVPFVLSHSHLAIKGGQGLLVSVTCATRRDFTP